MGEVDSRILDNKRMWRAPYKSAAEPGDMAGRCNIVFFVVPGSAEIDQMLKGRGSMLTAAKRGLVLYDLTTSEPTMTKKLAAKAKRKNVHYLDAGMSGGGQGAEAGTLALMIGGDKRVFNRTKETLGVFTKKLA